MSGYCEQCGVFELTATKAQQWFRRRDLPAGFEPQDTWMQGIALLLRLEGLEVLAVGSAWLKVRATPEQLWEALSGQPSDPERSRVHYRGPGHCCRVRAVPRFFAAFARRGKVYHICVSSAGIVLPLCRVPLSYPVCEVADLTPDNPELSGDAARYVPARGGRERAEVLRPCVTCTAELASLVAGFRQPSSAA